MNYSTSVLAALAISLSAGATAPEALNKQVPASVQIPATTEQVTLDASAKTISPVVKMRDASFNGKAKVAVRAAGDVSYAHPTPFRTGLSTERRSYSGVMRGGAYIPVTWKNTSTVTGDCEWNFMEELYDTNDLSLNLPFEYYDYPTLTIGDETFVYTFVGNDGNNYPYAYMAGGSNANLFGPDDLDYGIQTFTDPTSGSWMVLDLFGYPTDESWKEYYGEKAPDAEVTGMCNVFPAPNSPYFTTKMWAWMSVKADQDFPLNVTIYEIEEDGSIGEAIASGETLVPSTSDGMIEFDLMALDEDGLETEEPITISTAVAVVLSGFEGSEGLTSLIPVSQPGHVMSIDEWRNHNLPYPNHAYTVISGTHNGEEFTEYVPQIAAYYTDQTHTELIQTSDYGFFLDATFAWCVPVDGNTVITVPDEGGDVVVPIESYWLPTAYSVYNYAEADAEWIFDISGNTPADEDYIEFIFNCDALPSDVEGRQIDLTFEAPGIKPLTLTLVQGKPTAISGVNADKNVQSVQYFDMMGRKLNAAPENGLYIQKSVMTDGSVNAVKVVK